MPEYLAPGVYVEEVPAAVKPIAGVGTSTAGFIGVVEYGEVEPTVGALTGRTLKEALKVEGQSFEAGTTVTDQNVSAIIQAVGQDEMVKVSGGVRPTKQNLKGMTLEEEVNAEPQALKKGMPITTENVDAIIKAKAQDQEVKVSGEVKPTRGNLLGKVLQQPVKGAKKEFKAGAALDKAEAEAISLALGARGKVKVKPLTAANKPRLCTSFGEFVRYFGGFTAGSEGQNRLAHAIYGFFNNGGTRCWVTSVDKSTEEDFEKADSETNANLIQALESFKLVDEIALVAIPGVTDQDVQAAILDHCENEHLQDRFAVLDGKPDAESLTKEGIRPDLRNSSYGAIYFPWIEVRDPATGTSLSVPPSGHLAGVFARVDATRGVHKAPANEVIRGARNVAQQVSKEVQAGLNPEGINILRKFNGNVTVWGARTWADPQKESDLVYINVRRLLLFLRESIDQGTQWVVFEPNSPDLWAKITRNVTAFLTNVWRDGALFGSTPQEAFYVKCDEETNPPELRDLGQLVTEIGVAVVRPAEFVIFRISQWSGPGG
jgi:phage tail sheath protein FI